MYYKKAVKLLNPKKTKLWHPESPGMKVIVVRTWVGRLLKPSLFATYKETIKQYTM